MKPAPNSFGATLQERLGQSVSRMNVLRTEIKQSIRVAVPAIVQSFNPGPPATCVLQIALKEYFQKSDPTGVLNPITVLADLPPLHDCPVKLPTGGGWSITFPIQPGDECMAVFSDAALDAWLQSGGYNNAPISQRRHSLSDAIADFGLRSTPRGIANYSTESMQLRSDDGTVVIDLALDQITITAPNVVVNATAQASIIAPTVTLGSDALNRSFLSHTHTSATAGSPTGPVL
jgi:hypothetical protein